MGFRAYLEELRKVPVEEPLEPELKQNRHELDKQLREEEDIGQGAVREAVISHGHGDEQPSEGDLVYVHLSIKDADEDLLYTTRADDGGSGQPLAFVLEKGQRCPRAWELALKGMSKGGRKALQVKPSYGYQHPDCKLQPPPGVPADQPLVFDLELVKWYPGADVRVTGDTDALIRRGLEEGSGWETPRPPFEVAFTCSARAIAYDGIQLTGFQYYQSETPLEATLGSGALPDGLEECLGTMCKGERTVFVVPAESMAAAGRREGQAGSSTAPLLPPPPKRCTQVELELQVLGFVQVRDMTGTGEVLKRRVREGEGEFPMDCPLQDVAMVLRCRVRLQGAPDSQWRPVPQPSSSVQQNGDGRGEQEAGQKGEEAPSISVETGCGELPEGVEMAAKLMLPGETARVVCAPRYAYQGRDDTPAGIGPSDKVEFEVTLVSFEKEGHWQVMPLPERLALAERMKAAGNALYKQGRTNFAKSRYERLFKLLSSIRDYETDEEEAEGLRLQVACCNNMAVCTFALQEYPESVQWCDKGLRLDDTSAKLLLRKGKALTMKGDFEEAAETLEQAKEMDPSLGSEVEAALVLNRQRERQATKKQKQQFRNFFDRSL